MEEGRRPNNGKSSAISGRREKSVSPKEIPTLPNVFDEQTYHAPNIKNEVEGVTRFKERRSSGKTYVNEQSRVTAKVMKNRKL